MKSKLFYLIPMLFIATQVFGQPERMGEQGMGQRVMKLVEELKLTEDQQKKTQELRFDLMKQMASHRAKVATAAIEFRELAAKDNPEKAALEKKIKEISDLRAQGQTMMLNHWFNVNKLLTPEQQKVWKKTLGARMFEGPGMQMRGRMRGMDDDMRPGMERHRRMMRDD